MDWQVFIERWRPGGERSPEPRPARVPDGETAQPEAGCRDPIVCEGQAFMIEYTAVNGEKACRTVSAEAICFDGDGTPVLKAYCHHRRGSRMFRVDTLDCCIDFNGEAHEATDFLAENLGLHRATGDTLRGLDLERLSAARERAQPHAVLLAGLSRSDGYLHPRELDVLQRHCESLSPDLNDAERERLRRGYTRLRPAVDQMQDALATLKRQPDDEIKRFLQAAHELVYADGQLTADEKRIYEGFYGELSAGRV
ncbi:tellurite resistance TerB family protein [Maricaulis sp. CAU 1757]